MSSSNIISICIPAHNEEQSITSTLNSVRDALGYLSGYQIELLICANACTDNTADRIKEWAELNDLPVKIYDIDNVLPTEEKVSKNSVEFCLTILITKTPGKPNALNNLCSLARGDILILIDADVIVHPEAFGFLIRELIKNPEMKGAGGIVLAPGAKGFNLLYRRMAIKMKEFATKPAPYLNGPLYAVRKDSVKSIPDEIIADDAYNTMMIGVKNIAKVSAATAFQVPPNTYRDYFKRQLRNKLADLQLRHLYGEEYKAFRKETRDNRTKEERELSLTKGERILKRLLFLQAWISKILDRMAKIQAKRLFNRGMVRWYTIPSTKKINVTEQK